MTPKEIDAMVAGRQTDALVARYVMDFLQPTVLNMEYMKYIPHYSTDIGAAWLVAEKLNLLQSPAMLYREGDIYCIGHLQWEWAESDASADTAPLAICRAALKAVTSVP